VVCPPRANPDLPEPGVRARRTTNALQAAGHRAAVGASDRFTRPMIENRTGKTAYKLQPAQISPPVENPSTADLPTGKPRQKIVRPAGGQLVRNPLPPDALTPDGDRHACNAALEARGFYGGAISFRNLDDATRSAMAGVSSEHRAGPDSPCCGWRQPPVLGRDCRCIFPPASDTKDEATKPDPSAWKKQNLCR